MLHFVQQVICIGLGGIGSWFVPPFLRFLHAENFSGEVRLADGDTFSEKNLARQDALHPDIGKPKAEALAERLLRALPGLRLRTFTEFLTEANAAALIKGSSLVVVAVDNHPARAVAARRAATLRDVCVLSAGNEKYDGNVHVLLRRAGRDLTATLLDRHPEIGTAKAGDRARAGCEERIARGETQLLVTNFLAASALLLAVHALWDRDARPAARRRPRLPLPQELYFDVRELAINAVPVSQPERQDRPALHAVA